ncbi:MAG TPA: RsbRD N-terminal domain-containing protein [Longimicrobiaceae bacterium]
MDTETAFFTPAEARGIADVMETLRAGREDILRDWLERVRVNQTVQAGQALNDPLLLDHVPQLFDAIVDRLEVNRPRQDAEQFATVHGFARRLSGYNIAETVLELMMFRRAIWAHLTAVGARVEGAYAAMEQIDGMVDRSVLASVQAFLDPSARMMGRPEDGSPEGSAG